MNYKIGDKVRYHPPLQPYPERYIRGEVEDFDHDRDHMFVRFENGNGRWLMVNCRDLELDF